MSYLGAYLGGGFAETEEEPETPPTPIPVPIVFGDVAYFDTVARALDRLCQQFKSGVTE